MEKFKNIILLFSYLCLTALITNCKTNKDVLPNDNVVNSVSGIQRTIKFLSKDSLIFEIKIEKDGEDSFYVSDQDILSLAYVRLFDKNNELLYTPLNFTFAKDRSEEKTILWDNEDVYNIDLRSSYFISPFLARPIADGVYVLKIGEGESEKTYQIKWQKKNN